MKRKVHNIKGWFDTSFSSVVTYCGLESVKGHHKTVMTWRGIPKKDRCLRCLRCIKMEKRK